MSVAEHIKQVYDECAVTYDDFAYSTPLGQLESQLFKIALGECTGLTVLDLGGGSGVHARQAVELGAATVDIVDLSPGMLKAAQSVEKSLGRKDTIRVFEADAAKPLSHLQLRDEGYDVVLANWVFSYAGTTEVLEAMFSNVVGYLKPGGRFVGVREADPRSPVLQDERYGCTYKTIQEIPGGFKCLVVLHTTPPMEFESNLLEVIYSGSTEIYEKFGLTDVKAVPPESAEMVQKDPEFWKRFLDRPCMAVTKAVKK